MTETDNNKSGERVIIIHPILFSSNTDKDFNKKAERLPEVALEEARGLADAIDLDIAHSEIIKLKKAITSTLLGSGMVERIGGVIEEFEAGLVFINHALSPIQQRNLEEIWGIKVVDRTGLILEIFGERAKTKEGKLQVELASLDYQRSRLVKAWSHLERQRGGGGFTGGPGETQKELDRRMIDMRIKKIKQDIEKVRKNRLLQRESRKKEPFPVIAIVGYTNAGKSTLFNYMTGSKVFAKDLLFATLDTTMRGIKMPSGKKAILSDTVGFISDLPTHLVTAFRATLEDVQDAAVILHVRDISQENTEAEKEDVIKILKDLGIDSEDDHRIIEVLNKTDQLAQSEVEKLNNRSLRKEKNILTSAITGEGINNLISEIDKTLCQNQKNIYTKIPLTDGKAIAWLYDNATVIERKDDDELAYIKIGIEIADIKRFESQFSYKMNEKKVK